MRRNLKIIISAAAALSMAAAPVTAMAEEFVPEPGQVYDEATWNRIHDNVLEYDEIELLIDEYNTTLKNVKETYADNKNSYKSVSKYKEDIMEGAGALLEQAQKMQGDAENLKDNPYTLGAYASAIYGVEQMNANAERMILSVDSLPEKTPEMLKLQTVDSTRATLISAAQSAMIGYERLLIQQASLEDTVAMLKEVLSSKETQVSIGMATANDVLTAKQNLESMEATLLSVNAGIDQTRQSLCTMMGWAYDASPEIRPVPAADASRIGGMNPEIDKEKAIENNYTLRYNLLDYENKTDGSVEKQNLQRTIDNQRTAIASSMTNLYNDVLQKKNEYDTAVTAYGLEQAKMQTAETKYQLGMIGRLEYLQQKNALVTKETTMKNADLALFQAMETYDWAVAGNLAVS